MTADQSMNKSTYVQRMLEKVDALYENNAEDLLDMMKMSTYGLVLSPEHLTRIRDGSDGSFEVSFMLRIPYAEMRAESVSEFEMEACDEADYPAAPVPKQMDLGNRDRMPISKR